jgi:DNA-cytosine methyltransferase
MFKILDLFSGAGGFSHGFEMNKNFKVVLANDYNDDALQTFKHNHKDVEIIFGDITKDEIKKEIINKSKEKLVDFIIGGPPCQGFSVKGKKMGLEDERNFLFLEFLEIVKNVKPKIFVIENVPSIVSAADGYFINEIKKNFEKIGYSINFDILNSSDFGVPQSRRRAFIIGSLVGQFDFPELKKMKQITIYDAISDLNYLESGDIKHKREYLNDSKTEYQNKMRKDSKFLFNHSSTKHTNETLQKLLMIPEKGTKLNLPVHLRTRQKFKNT